MMTALSQNHSPPVDSLLRVGYPVVVFFAALFAWNSSGESAKLIDASLPPPTENSRALTHEPSTEELPGSPASCEIKGARASLAMDHTSACRPAREARTSQVSTEVRKAKRE